MGEKIRNHIRGNVIGYVALFVALSGTAYANHETILSSDIVDGKVKNQDLAPDSVGTGKIIDGQVQNADLAAGSVATGNILDANVFAQDLAPDSVGSAKIVDGAVGSSEIADGGVETSDIATGAVGTREITEGGVAADDIGVLPGARVSRSGNQTIAAGASDTVVFNSEQYDTGDFFESAAPTRLTAPLSGRYLITANVTWSPGNAGVLGCREVENDTGATDVRCDMAVAALRVNGTGGPVLARDIRLGYSQVLATVSELTAGDFVELRVRYDNLPGTEDGPHESPDTILGSAQDPFPYMAIQWLGPSS